jgi:hypothetical protein
MTTPTLEDFHAHVLYLTDCRNRGVIGITWAVMAEDIREAWRMQARKAFEHWLEMERQQAERLAGKDSRGFFVP